MGELKEAVGEAGLSYEYRLTYQEALRTGVPSFVIAAIILVLSLPAVIGHQPFPPPGSFLVLVFLLAGIATVSDRRGSTWCVEEGVARQRRPRNRLVPNPRNRDKRVDLHNLRRIRLTGKWWSVRDRSGERCLFPSDMLQNKAIVAIVLHGVRASQASGHVDMDATTALLLARGDESGGPG